MGQPIAAEIAFKEVFNREYERLCRYALTYMQDENMAEDVVQETFIKIWEQKRELISSENIKFYLITAVKNNCISVIRKQNSQKTQYTDNTPEPEPEPFLTRMQLNEQENERLTAVKEALDRLPPKCKEVFLLVKMQGLSYKQVAEALELSVKTVENQMGKALKILRESTMQQVVLFLFSLIINGFSN
jgi:RNA polymerase sigma-70 factor (ECF subfamily)